MTLIEHILPLILITFFVCYIAFFICQKTSILKIQDNHKHRYIDSLRGIAAILVFFHHAVIGYFYLQHRGWHTQFENTDILIRNLATNFGHIAVSIFFMITSFLFFEKFILNRAEFNPYDFYKKRILRIAPMYLVSVFAIFIAFFLFGFPEEISLEYSVAAVLGWLSFGYYPQLTLSPNVDAVAINAGIFWTLAIEWKFYLLFPFLLIFTRTVKQTALFIIMTALLLGLLVYSTFMQVSDAAISMYFINGLICALIYKVNHAKLNKVLAHWLFALFSLALFGYVFIYFDNIYTWVGNIVLGLLFLAVVNGNSLLGILKLKVLAFVGLISYSIYLLHGIILIIVGGIVFKGSEFVVLVLFAAFFTLLFSILGFKYVEQPFMLFNKKTNKQTQLFKW